MWLRFQINALEQHDQGPDQTSHADTIKSDGKEKNDTCCGHIEKDQSKQEFPKAGNSGNKPDKPINDTAKYQRRNETQRKNIKENLKSSSQPWCKVCQFNSTFLRREICECWIIAVSTSSNDENRKQPIDKGSRTVLSWTRSSHLQTSPN